MAIDPMVRDGLAAPTETARLLPREMNATEGGATEPGTRGPCADPESDLSQPRVAGRVRGLWADAL